MHNPPSHNRQGNSNSNGIHTEVDYAAVIEKILWDIRYFSLSKTTNPTPYFNAINHLAFTASVYFEDDLKFQEEINNYSKKCEEEFAQLKTKLERDEYTEKELPMKSHEYLYVAVLRGLKRQQLLPKRREVIQI